MTPYGQCECGKFVDLIEEDDDDLQKKELAALRARLAEAEKLILEALECTTLEQIRAHLVALEAYEARYLDKPAPAEGGGA